MEVPISQFRKNLFTLVDQALEGKEVWVRHKGRRVRIVPDSPTQDKLSRVTPLEILAPGVSHENDSWKVDVLRDWERKWDRRLAQLSEPAKIAPTAARSGARKTRKA